MSDRMKFYLIIAAQILFLMALAGTKVYTLTAGEKVLLEVVPVDPRSLFRGEYARLNYTISTIGLSGIERFSVNQAIYVTLKKEGDYWTAAGISDRKPSVSEGEIVITGRVIYRNRVLYGIESYFLPEGKAIRAERLARKSKVAVEVSVDRFGNSAISRVLVDGRPLDEFLK